MSRKLFILLALFTMVWSGSALAAQGFGKGRGPGGSGSQAWGGFRGAMASFHQDEENSVLLDRIRLKRQELRLLFKSTELDAEKAVSVNQELNRMTRELADKRFEFSLDLKKRNPDWTPGFGQNRTARRGNRNTDSGDSAGRRRISQGPMAKFFEDESVTALLGKIEEKRNELAALFSEQSLNEEQTRKLHDELLDLRTDLSDKRFAFMIELKKRNPDWQPNFGQGSNGPGRKGGGRGFKAQGRHRGPIAQNN